VALLCAYTGFVGLRPRATASEPTHSAQPVPGLRADDVRGHWIENAIAGPIYVVSGELRAISAAPLPPGSLLRIHFLDADGAAIGGEPAAVGPRVSSELLREWSLRDLKDLEERGAVRLAWDPLAPGERRWFQAILGRVPTPAVAFGFEVAAAPSPEPETESGTEGLPPAADLDPRTPIE
jgi:hypothetical protein